MKLGWCVPYLHGFIHVPTFELWINNNRNHGINNIIIYGHWFDIPIHLNEYLDKKNIIKRNYTKILPNISFHRGISYNQPYQQWAIQDCFTFTRTKMYDWVFFGDTDEFITLFSPVYEQNHAMHTFLTHQQSTCISFGKQQFANVISERNTTGICARMLTTKRPYCYKGNINRHHFCKDWLGGRKYAIQPKKIIDSKLLKTHSCGNEATISTTIARLNHWWGAIRANYFKNPSYMKNPLSENTKGLVWLKDAYGPHIGMHQDKQSMIGCP